MHPRSVLTVLAALLIIWPSIGEAKRDFNYTGCGGAAKCLGDAGLEKLRIRSGMKHRSRAQLARVLDEDHDLVRNMEGCYLDSTFGVPGQMCSSFQLLSHCPVTAPWCHISNCCTVVTCLYHVCFETWFDTCLQGFDTTNDMLMYACAGLTAPEPKNKERGQHKRHQHRSLKGLLPTAPNAEIVSGWLVRQPGRYKGRTAVFLLCSACDDLQGLHLSTSSWPAPAWLAAVLGSLCSISQN
jgi:hypothetical protein